MSKYRDLNSGDVLPASWTDALQEFISTLESNVNIVRQTTTSIRIPGGSGSSQVGLGIDGMWRFNAVNADAAHPGGGAATDQPIWAVTSDNIFGPLDADTTDYNFGLVITTGAAPSGSAPSPASGTITHYRQIGTVDWDGTKITAIKRTGGFVVQAFMSSGQVIVGNADNNPRVRTMIGDVVIADDGTTTVQKIAGNLDHDGSQVGFYGVTPVSRPAAITNSSGLSAARTLPSGYTINDAVKWLIAVVTDLKNNGLEQ